MALIKCAECGKETNDAKKQCTNCGYKNKLNIDMYLKYDTTNTKKCIKCGNVLNKDDCFCTKCGYKRDNQNIRVKNFISLIKTIILRNIKICIPLLIVLLSILLIFNENKNFKRDIILAENYYNNKEFYEASQIVDKYSKTHKDNEFIKKYTFIKYLLTDYQMASPNSSYNKDSDKLKYLFWGYRDCLERNTTNKWESDLVEEVTNIYYNAINNIVSLSKSEIEKICLMEETEREQKIKELIKQVEKKNTCNKVNISIIDYWKNGYKLDVTLKNNNGCTWSIKSYSEVRVYFTDNSYEDVYLSTNINLKSDEKYTFLGCYLGSDNKYKTVKSVTFID